MKELVGDITSPRMPFQVGQIEFVWSDQSRSLDRGKEGPIGENQEIFPARFKSSWR